MDEPTVRSRGRQEGGEPVRPTIEDERLLDHHIEEVLGALNDAAGPADSTPEDDARQRE
jgi:hypothetical protein